MNLKLLLVSYKEINIHSLRVGIRVMAKNLIYKRYQNPLKGRYSVGNHSICCFIV